MTGGNAPGGKKKPRIEIIPLIDVVFFLLATFILFTLSLNTSGGLRVALPDAETGGARDRADSVTITVTSEGQLAWDKDIITLDEFLVRLQTYKQVQANPRVLINGDEDAYFSQARYVFDEARKAGIQRVFIETLSKAN
jgi:biopolymer transport protein ExbD